MSFFQRRLLHLFETLSFAGVGSVNLVGKCMVKAMFNSSFNSLSAKSSIRKH